jgi:hypothetical protein
MAESERGRETPGHVPLETLRRRLCDAQPPYQLIVPPSTEQARFRFTGPFEGKEIVWDATLMTLDHYVRQGCENGRYRKGETVELQQFLEISDEPIEPLPILIVHDIPKVDSGRLLKTVIMVRNYKRLHRGRHPYGESHRFVIEADED